MINCTFPYKLESTEEFDRICTMEIMPAILKAYGSIAARHDPMNDALLSAATERIIRCVSDLCRSCEQSYSYGQPDERTQERANNFVRAWNVRDTYSEECQVSSRTASQTLTD